MATDARVLEEVTAQARVLVNEVLEVPGRVDSFVSAFYT
jgi:hypothetical protein